MAYKLYGAALSPYSARCRMQMYAKGLEFEAVSVFDKLSPEEFANLTPLKKVPALDVDGLILPESQVIAEYLEDVETDVPLLPATAEERARVRLLARIGDLYLMMPLGKLFGQVNPQGRDPKLVQYMFGELDKAMGWLSHYVDGSKYAVGDKLSLADCALIPMLFFSSNITPLFGRECMLCETPVVHNYFTKTLDDPAVARVVQELEEAFAKMMGPKTEPQKQPAE
jgi:glutathione S-transferase